VIGCCCEAVAGVTILDRMRRRLGALELVQVARIGEQLARRRDLARLGGDMKLADEPLHLIASDRMALPVGDVAEIDLGDRDPRQIAPLKPGQRRPPRVTTNVLGLIGPTPALPAFYSEVQLQRRRLRDRAMAAFVNIFDHRALSFFWRAFAKYNWAVNLERAGGRVAPAGEGLTDPISGSLLAFSGFATASMRDRLAFDDAALVRLAHHFADTRRSAAGLALVLRRLTGLDVTVVEAEPVWMALPLEEQTRLGGPGLARFARLGGTDPVSGLGAGDAAMVGAAVLDIQHHFLLSIGPLDWPDFVDFCGTSGARRAIGEICRLYAGLEYQPLLRLTIPGPAVRPIRLGDPAVPAWLGRTCWLGEVGPALRSDCQLAMEPI
jgi:type VI secretion system protein ImpH